jgi:adenylate kinase
MRLILLGCPGAGKGTQSKLIAANYHIPQISTGDIFRAAIEQGTHLGSQVKAIVEGGQLVPDEIVIQLVKDRIKQSDCQNGFLLDGFPRTVAQAEALQKITPIDAVIDIDVSEEDVVRRLSGRRIHPASGRTYHIINQPPKNPDKDDLTGEPLIQRPDDREETIRRRLQVYQAQTLPLIEYYKNFKEQPNLKKPEYIKVDGIGSIREIQDKILSRLDNIRK